MGSILTLLILLALASPVVAADGKLEINQTCAVSTGCFSGDTPGFPVTIAASGSFILTSSLSAGGGISAAIEITMSNVELDLRGFSVSSTGSAVGIISTPGAERVTVRGGRVQAGNTALDLPGISSRIVDLAVKQGAILCGDSCWIERVDLENGSPLAVAVQCGSDSSIINSKVRVTFLTDDDAIIVGSRTLIRDSYVFAFDNRAIMGSDAVRIVDTVIGYGGIWLGSESIVTGSSIKASGQVPIALQVGSSSLVQSNVINGTVHNAGGNSSFVDNVFTTIGDEGFPAISVSGTGAVRLSGSSFPGTPVFSGTIVDAGGNVCGGTLGCP